MRTPPADLSVESVRESLYNGWKLSVGRMEYVPEGGGSHHWKVTDGGGRLHFVTVDELDNKPWMGGDLQSAFKGLSRAYATARSLRHSTGLTFVVAPIKTIDGNVLCRLDHRYTASLFPYAAGRSYRFGAYGDSRLRHSVLEMITALHRATPFVRDQAPVHVLGFGGRSELEAFLADPDRAWTGGPLSETAREMVAGRAEDLVALIASFDRLADLTAPARSRTVITHGEPHPGNVMSVDGREVLVDWDTVGLAPAERDLSLIVTEDGDAIEHYERATGHKVDPTVMVLYRLRWLLDDVGSAVRMFRNPHLDTPDTRRWWEALPARMESVPEWLERLESGVGPA